MVRIRIRRPDPRLSLTKSMPHCLSEPQGVGSQDRSDQGRFLAGTQAQGETFLTVDPFRPFVIHHNPSRRNKTCSRTTPEAPPLLLPSSRSVVIPIRWVRMPNCAAIDAEGRAGQPLGGGICLWTYCNTASWHDAGLRSFLRGPP